jgi:G:T/U-mismatch repair DNA glycosylase
LFLHKHPYQPFIQKNTKKLIVGTLPPPRFSIGRLLAKDVNFCYGSCYNSLWLFIDKIHTLNLRYDNSQEAIDQRKAFLIKQQIGICDIVNCAEREKIDASDLGMRNIKLRNLIGYLRKYPSIETILFIGGNSKNGPEYFFRKHIKAHSIKIELVTNVTPKIHKFNLDERIIQTVSLTSSSGSANRAIGSMPLYQQLKKRNPNFNTFDFRILQYENYI